MFVVQPIRYRHKLLVPAALTCFIPADQENCSAPRIEGEQHAVRLTPVLNTQFLHIGVLRGRYGVHMGPSQRRAKAPKQVYLRPHVHLFGFVQTVPPGSKFIRKLYFPFLQRNIPPKAYSVNTTIRENVTASGVARKSTDPQRLHPKLRYLRRLVMHYCFPSLSPPSREKGARVRKASKTLPLCFAARAERAAENPSRVRFAAQNRRALD